MSDQVTDVGKLAEDELFEVPVTQYLMPNGRRRETSTKLPVSCRDAYEDMTKHGLCFEAEMLQTGAISVTIANRKEEEDIDISLTQNGPEVQTGMIEMLKRGLWKK